MADKPLALVTPEFRLSYPKLFEPEVNDAGKKVYSFVALFAKGADLSELKAAAKKAAIEKWGDKMPPKLATPFRDQGEKRRDDGTMPVGYEPGAVFVTFRSYNEAPNMYSPSVKPITEPSDVYGGMYACAAVEFRAFEFKGKFGVGAYVKMIQKLRDGEPFGKPRIRAEDAFDAVEGAGSGASAGDSVFE